MAAKYDIEVLERPGVNLSSADQDSLQHELCELGSTCLHPLPQYQVFDTTSTSALDDKVIVTIRDEGKLIAFVSSVLIHVQGVLDPVLHTGITIIHPLHRRSHVKRLLFGNLFVHMLSKHPDGIWLTSLAEIITSLVHIAKYTTQVFPSPEWTKLYGDSNPSEMHLHIALEISEKHRDKMLIGPEAEFDEERFIFYGSNDHKEGKVFMKDVDDDKHWHQDSQATNFFRNMFRRNMGDEVLQVGYLDMGCIMEAMEREGYQEDGNRKVSKL